MSSGKERSNMERSNYEAYMDCLQPLERLCLSVLTGLVLWEKITECKEAGLPLSSIDIEQASFEVVFRYRRIHGDLSLRALCEWAMRGHAGQTTEYDDAAADKGGCSVSYNNST